jgi:hypothetical protein
MTAEHASTPAALVRKGLLERLAAGPVICAEGYVFELERRGYLQAGPYVPEAVIENPDVVRRLHEDFVHAGSDVVEAFTYYAHRQKLKVIGRENILEDMNRKALRIARDVADRHGCLMAGDICNTGPGGRLRGRGREPWAHSLLAAGRRHAGAIPVAHAGRRLHHHKNVVLRLGARFSRPRSHADSASPGASDRPPGVAVAKAPSPMPFLQSTGAPP